MTETSSYTSVLALVCSVFDAYSALLFLPGADNREDCHLAGYFSLGDAVDKNVHIMPGKGLAGWILRNRQPLLVPNFDQRQSNLGYYAGGEEAHIKAFMGCPVPGGGILCVDSKRQYSFSDKDHKILQLFAELISRQQDNAQQASLRDIPQYFAQLGVIQGLRFRHKRWPVFLKHFLRAVVETSGFDYCAFASIDPSGESYSVEGESARLLLESDTPLRLSLSSGLAGWVLRDERQGVFIEGTDGGTTATLFGKLPDVPDFEAIICLPVCINKSARGVLCLGHTSPRALDEALRSFVHLCVDHLALFLENIYLKNRLRAMMPKAHLHSKGALIHDPDHKSGSEEA